MISSLRRLACDLKEVQANPLPDVAAGPVGDDLSVWHANLRGAESSDLMGGLVLHLVIKFPADYPAVPPRIRLCTGLPHPNVLQTGGGYKLCLVIA